MSENKQAIDRHSETVQIGDYAVTMTFSAAPDPGALTDIKAILCGQKILSSKPSKICEKA